MTSTATGSMSSFRKNDADPDDVPGSHPSQKTKTARRKVAEAHSGTEVVTTDRSETDRSLALPSALPDKTPSTSEMMTVRLNTHRASIPVLARLGRSTCKTGRLNWIEVPKSPKAARPTHAI